MKELEGNIINLAEDKTFDVILQGCNCFHTMGSGLAKEIRERYPEAYFADRDNSKYGDPAKLGTFTYAVCKRKDLSNFTIINCYTQFRYGKDGQTNRYVEYGAIRSCLIKIKEFVVTKNAKIGIPLIGCGLAGGDWEVVKRIIEEEMGDFYNCQIVIFK